MKKILSCCLVLVMVTFNLGSLYAATSVNLATTATVPASTPGLTVVLKKIDDGNPDNDPFTVSTTVTSMAFGPLKHTLDDGSEAGVWFAKSFFCAVVFAQPFGKPYDIKSSSVGIFAGAIPLPPAAFVLSPVYAEQDKYEGSPNPQGPMPTGASLGATGSAVGANKLVYSSETGAATARILQAYYSIPPDGPGGVDPYPGWSGVPLTQSPGSYSGTVTLTITLK